MGVYSVLVAFVTQLCSPSNVCVCGVWTHVCIHKAHFPSSPRLAQLFYLHHTPHLGFGQSAQWYKQCPDSTILRTHVKSANTQTLPYPRSMTILKSQTITTFNRKLLEKQSVKNSFASYEVHSEFPDSTIFKILTILKWRMITTLNRKVLEKQRLQLLPTRYTYRTHRLISACAYLQNCKEICA